MKIFAVTICVCLALMCVGCATETGDLSDASIDFSHGKLQVSANQRYLQFEDGTPFFYLGDTAWELFHRLNRQEVELYLENRRQKRFTVIQAVALAELDGLQTPNAHGDIPLKDLDPAQPLVTEGTNPENEEAYDYWDHVDFVVKTAEEKGMFVGLLPTWGDKFVKIWGVGPVVFTPDNARAFGEFLGKRYKDAPNIIWVLGGDRPAEHEGVDYKPIIRAMADGILSEDQNHLVTYHPWGGGTSSSSWFHEDDWLDFNMLQSGHGSRDFRNDEFIDKDYVLSPTKPCMDAEPRYEDHAVNWKPENGWFDDFDVRQAAYWGLFAGGHGHTYGNHSIWQMFDVGRDPITGARHPWHWTLDLDGAFQMTYMRQLMESRPMLERIPDQSLVVTQPEASAAFIRATRGESYAFIYTPHGYNITVKMGIIGGEQVEASWFNPRNGQITKIGKWANTGEETFVPLSGPGRCNDWVLILDGID